MISLKRLRELGDGYLEDIRHSSHLVNKLNGDEKFDLTGVFGLKREELDALFSGIRNEWKEWEELHNFIDMETLEEELRLPIYQYLQELKSSFPEPENNNQDKNENQEHQEVSGTSEDDSNNIVGENNNQGSDNDGNKWKWIIASIIFSVIGILAIRSLPYFFKPKLEADSITIGTIWTPESQAELSDYLEQTLVPKNYWDFLQGEKIEVIINGDKTLPYKEAQQRIANYQWDIAFATSPVISIFAKDTNYKFVALMFPNSEVYQSGLIVRRQSSIQTIDDIKPKHTIALGSLGRSASSFYMPVYKLYGKTLNVDYGNRGNTIKEKVRSGEVDVGAVAITSFEPGIQDENSDFRLIHRSRNIPSSAVYLSPRLSSSDRETLNQVLLDAPKKVKKFENSNYGAGQQPDFSEFRKIMNRVDKILICSNFSENPVRFFCPEGFEPVNIIGKVNGWSSEDNFISLNVSDKSGQIYKINVNRQILQEATGIASPNQLHNQIVKATVPEKKITDNNGKVIVEISQSSQISLKSKSLAKSVSSNCPSQLSFSASNLSKINQHQGCQATVSGLVHSAYQPTSGNLFLLNLGSDDYKKAFQVVIFQDSFNNFSEPLDSYKGKKISVSGTIDTYEGDPQIVADSPKQIEIVE